MRSDAGAAGVGGCEGYPGAEPQDDVADPRGDDAERDESLDRSRGGFRVDDPGEVVGDEPGRGEWVLPGADPGPACYGRGGTEATVTDASIVLGYLDPAYFAGGTM